jgi:hypothetical protein
MMMHYLTSPNERIVGPLPRRDILAICAFLNRAPSVRRFYECRAASDDFLHQLAAAARMQ